MKFNPPLEKALLLRRYKRFLADIELANGEITTIHCPNTGSMKNCIVERSRCWYSVSHNPKRKYPFSWEIATTPDGHLAGVNTGRANALVKEAIDNGVITELQGYSSVQAEVSYGQEGSRIDFFLSDQERASSEASIAALKPSCYVEVKSVTLSMGAGEGLFPDSVSSRGAKHLRELISVVQQGYRGVLVFCVQHSGIKQVSPADTIDPVYGQTLRQAIEVGVEVLVYGADINEHGITLTNRLPLILP